MEREVRLGPHEGLEEDAVRHADVVRDVDWNPAIAPRLEAIEHEEDVDVRVPTRLASRDRPEQAHLAKAAPQRFSKPNLELDERIRDRRRQRRVRRAEGHRCHRGVHRTKLPDASHQPGSLSPGMKLAGVSSAQSLRKSRSALDARRRGSAKRTRCSSTEKK